MSDIAIKADDLSKYYRLGVINNGTLFKDFQSWLARKTGKDDPHSQIDSKYDPTIDGFWALKGLNFEIHQGDRVGIIGKNGAGKSTLLKILSRITAPTEGKVYIKGRVASLLEVGTGFHAELTGRENIYLNGAILGMKKKEVDQKIDEIIAFSEIEQHIDTPVKRYSSGMYVRLAFSVAAHLDSEILIADEVLAVGDANFQKKAIGKMNQLSKGQGRTVLFVSHQIPAVVNLCNQGIFLEKGRIVPSNSLQDCIDYYFNTGAAAQTAYWDEGIENEYLKITKAYISGEDNITKEKSDFEKDDKIFVNFDYEIIKPGFKYVFAMEVMNKKGNTVCVNSATDKFTDEEYEKAVLPGKHSLRLEMDSSIFGTGTYHVKLDIAIHNIICFTAEKPILTFNLKPKNNIVKVLDSEWRQEVINPNWKWTCQ